MKEYKFINESLFFPEKGILVIGDLHIGYDFMLRQSGVLIPERQIKDILKRINNIFEKIKTKEYKIKKVIFLGDIKHSFSYEFTERDEFRTIMDFTASRVGKENIILIKGNHDTMDYTLEKSMKYFHIEEDIAFLHGHEIYPEVFDKKIKTVVSGHLHPSIILSENPGVKKEIFKCFLEGKSKGKAFIVMPSFLGIVEGTPVNNYKEDYIESFSIIPKKDIMKFQVHVVGEDGSYSFGKIRNL